MLDRDPCDVGPKPTACGIHFLVLFAAALAIGMYNVSGSGPLWPDSPRYANAGAMIHDWLLSGEYLQPYEFAKKNYSQYPSFNIPYHPPAYPAFLGSFFVVTGGVSYESARVFVALCLGGAGCFFFGILRRLGVGPAVSLACALLLLTTPEVVRWGRDTMSDVPALAFLLAASYLFVVGLGSARPWHLWAAFALAELAFLCRVTTAGVLPAWFLYALLTGKSRRLFSRHMVLPAILFLAVNIAWVRLVVSFSKYETTENLGGGLERLSWANVCFYPSCLPAMVGWGSLAVALAGACLTARPSTRSAGGLFWLAWLFSSYVFWLALVGEEQRYFLFALPAIPGLCACLFAPGVPEWLRRPAPVLLGLALASNLMLVSQVPRGMVGYDAVAKQLTLLDKPGNILLACCEDQELIFRYRAHRPELERVMIRSDRSLTIRGPAYGRMEPEIIARTAPDVLEVIRRGRARYLVTCVIREGQYEGYLQEMSLAHETAALSSQSFALVNEFPLHIQVSCARGPCFQVYVWEYLGELPEGPSEIPVLIPTAGLVIQPSR